MADLEQMLLLKMLPYTKQKTRVAKEAEMLPAIAGVIVQAPNTIRSCRNPSRDGALTDIATARLLSDRQTLL